MRFSAAKVAAAVGAALALVLSGCATIPTSGNSGEINVGDGGSNVQSRIEPDGPANDAGPDEIVRGFLNAGAGYSNNFEVARSFLTDTFSSRWDPQTGVTVLPSGTSLDSVTSEITKDSQTVSLAMPVGGSLDSRKIYREVQSGTINPMRFSLRQVNGQWRISDAPNGLVVSATNFATLFQSYPLYFFTPDYRHLVPDVRWFVRSPSTPTEVTNELLRGPADYLTGAVASALPEGSRLDNKAVTVTDNRASVDLASTEGGLDDRTASRVVTQLQATLTGISSVNTVQVTSGGAELTSQATDADTSIGIPDDPIVIADQRIAQIEGTDFTAVPDSPKLPTDARSPSMAIDGSQYAYVANRGAEVQHFKARSARAQVLLRGKDFVNISFDRFGWLWTAEAKGRGILAVKPDGSSARLSARFLNGRTINEVHVSRDGTRLGVLSTDSETRQHIDVVGILRDQRSEPTRLGTATLSLGQRFSSVLSFSWAGADGLAVLGGGPSDSSAQPYTVAVSGPPNSLGTVTGGTTIAAGDDQKSVRVGTRDGSVYTYTGGTWQKIVDARAQDPAYAG